METRTQGRGVQWTPAQDARDRGHIQPYDTGAPGVVIDVSSAWQNVAPAEMAHTSGQDRARGLILKSIPVLVLELILSLAIVILAVQVFDIDADAGPMVFTILLLWGGAGLGSFLIMSERSDWYSSVGVEHHRVDSAETVAVEQIRADKDVRLEALRGYLQTMAQIEQGREQKQIGRDRGPLC